MTGGEGLPPEAVIGAAVDELRDLAPENRDLVLVGEPWSSGRALLFVLERAPARQRFVVKIPTRGDDAIDTDPPLPAPAQFAALERAHRWYRGEDVHAVVRPVALLPGVGAIVMEHVPGRSVTGAIRGARRHPEDALRAVTAAGDFLQRFHRRAPAAAASVALRDLADEVLTLETSLLHPVGLRLPRAVQGALEALPSRALSARLVCLHGDYVPNNLLLTSPDSVAMLDPLLVREGLPEDDLARFLAILSSETVFVPGRVLPRVQALRRILEDRFRRAYGPPVGGSSVLELRLMKELLPRWRRRRELSTLSANPNLLRLRAAVIDAHMRALLGESARRLAAEEDPAAKKWTGATT